MKRQTSLRTFLQNKKQKDDGDSGDLLINEANEEITASTSVSNKKCQQLDILHANDSLPKENNLAVNDSFLRKRKCPASYSSDSDEDYADHFSKLAVISPIKQQCQSLHGISNQNAHLKSRNLLMTLRKVCLHPITIQQDNIDLWSISDADHLIRECGKLLILDSLLTNLQKRGHKVLIFSQFVSMLDVLTKYCELKNWSFCRFDGQTDFDSRCSEIEKFQKNKSVSIFLLSTRAGGLGINLTEADTVIIYDSDWNPQQDIQAQDRCHRYGQTKPVVVYRLVSEGTVDEEIVAEALRKKKLEKLIIHEGRFSTNDTLSKVQNPLTADDVNKVFCDSSTISVRCKKDEPLSSTTLEKLLDRSDML